MRRAPRNLRIACDHRGLTNFGGAYFFHEFLRLLQSFVPRPDHRSRLIFDLDSSVVTVFGRQQKAEVGYNPRYRGKRSNNPLLCMEANSSYLWGTELRPGNAGT